MKSSRFAFLTLAAAACGASAPSATAPRNASTATEPEAPLDAAAPPTDAQGAADAQGVVVGEGEPAAPDGGSHAPAAGADASTSASACNEQPPQDFLVRGNFLKEGRAGLERAIQYRTDEYGYFKGYGHPAPGAKPPSAFVVGTTFMGLPVRMHRKVVPALKCVEEEIRLSCTDHPYTAHALAGIRFRNTYRGSEVTNHAYGIAIDVDPSINTCCGCVPPWNDAPACKKKVKSEYERMAMPECWVHAFERYGFYWLGHDVLQDTMHFEFLGDPDRISKDGAAPPSAPAERDGGT